DALAYVREIGVPSRRRREDLLEQRTHLFPLGAVRRGLALDRDELLHRRERRRRIDELVDVERRDARARLLRVPRRQRREARREQRDELAMAPLPLVEALERRGEPHVVRLEREELLEITDRAIGAIGEVLRGLRRLFEERDPLLAFRRRQRAIEEREEIVP